MQDDHIERSAQFPKDLDGHSADRDAEFWKHFSNMGATDKNTMIVIDTFLLGMSATTFGWLVTHLSGWACVAPKDSLSMTIVSAVGAIISLIAASVTLLYAGYSNRNWAQADRIARRRGWVDLLPPSRESERAYNKRIKGRSFLAGISWRLARSCYPEEELAWVFILFETLAIMAAVAHGVVLFWATRPTVAC